MTATANPSRSVILAALDPSDLEPLVLAHAARIARATAGGELHLVHVAPEPAIGVTTLGAPSAPTLPNVVTDEEVQRWLADQARVAHEIAGQRVATHLVRGAPWRGVVQLAADLDADLVVCGTHGFRGIERLAFGSVAELIVRRAPCPVFVVRPRSHDQPADPAIEPPCPDCRATQRETAGATLWCPRHDHRRPRAHVHYETPASYGVGSLTFRF